MKGFLIALVSGVFLFASAAFGAVNVNTATAEQLQALDGVGQVKAEAIVKYREQHGNFHNKKELMEVPGIGSATLKGLSDDIVVEEASGKASSAASKSKK
ncbi:MAG: helix-hairpin-helix domain-containing protein [Sinobacteraceae bacterium]|nr:helix-hairpin-helix domain-containing protein [Nevskiaceae bacterium]